MTHTLSKQTASGFTQTVEFEGSLAQKPKGWKAVTQGPAQTYTLSRKNPKTGFKETIEFEGPLSKKPRGWTLVH